MKRKIEFILGIIGGILGILISLLIMFIGYLNELGPVLESSTGEVPTNKNMILGLISLVISILGIVGSMLIKTKEGIGSLIMIVAAISGFICISVLYILPGIFLLISSLMIIFRKKIFL
ncbi:DUF4064 domain-containing protein [Bacillus sp. Xin]|uniref:DUF4064 domain-containing protein n=1 Tax=unclassified Bacillus (in: firmicutes) TaxID=185979 RepID=UPI0015724F4C|nr:MULTISPECIES: DUF4064 domain-containing protein [unclassified Bacillus (in: firmicutes)]MBC6972458.1 DUF4064 domain-containing protein [Bacillus sp. Xin]NSW39607.1 DUF4064 domain-containing protein [Bacillus sp. Xin1]